MSISLFTCHLFLFVSLFSAVDTQTHTAEAISFHCFWVCDPWGSLLTLLSLISATNKKETPTKYRVSSFYSADHNAPPTKANHTGMSYWMSWTHTNMPSSVCVRALGQRELLFVKTKKRYSVCEGTHTHTHTAKRMPPYYIVKSWYWLCRLLGLYWIYFVVFAGRRY